MRVVRRIAEVRAWRRRCVEKTVGFVPTMGALHEGHLSLVRSAKSECDTVTATIFVNPTQFGVGEDLSRYPRNEDADIAQLEAEGVDLVFVPDVKEIYPRLEQFSVQPPPSFLHLAEASARPRHFAGVATVCTKLFNIMQPTQAYFGQKDALQCAALRRLATDLNIPVDIRICQTQREADGLALSSRNAYLSNAERSAAPIVYKGLCVARDAWLQFSHTSTDNNNNSVPASLLIEAARSVYLAEPHLTSIEYISVADFDSMTDLDEIPMAADASRVLALESAKDDTSLPQPRSIISVALRLGQVRLIDNLPLRG